MSGTIYMLGSTRCDKVAPLTWKSKSIIHATKSVKDAETRAFSVNAENSTHFARMVRGFTLVMSEKDFL